MYVMESKNDDSLYLYEAIMATDAGKTFDCDIVQEKDLSPTPHEKPYLDPSFDFIISQEVVPLPVHVIEARMALNRRGNHAPRDATYEEFAKSLGITKEDTEDPVTHSSFLTDEGGVRSYFGDPSDEIYKAFLKNMVRFAENAEWIKESMFLKNDIQSEYQRLKRFEDGAIDKSQLSAEYINEMESYFYDEVRSRAHTECLTQYRADHSSVKVAKSLRMERRRRELEAQRAHAIHGCGVLDAAALLKVRQSTSMIKSKGDLLRVHSGRRNSLEPE